MNVTTTPVDVGRLVRSFREARGLSQLALSLEAGISTRHLSFIETGKANPSREMVLTLAEHLEVPLRERNTLLEAAGFAGVYRETPLVAPAMAEVRGALEHILSASLPNPAMVVNRRYDVLLANRAAERLIGFFAPSWTGPGNVAHMVLSKEGMRPYLVNWAEVAGHVVRRLRGELAALRTRDAADEAMFALVSAAGREIAEHPTLAPSASILVPVKFRRDGKSVDLFTTITTVGTPLDITLQELRIETLFPASPAAREWLAESTPMA